MARWTVKTKDGVLYEYDAYATVSGGAICLYMDDGSYQFWGPGFWEWAKQVKTSG